MNTYLVSTKRAGGPIEEIRAESLEVVDGWVVFQASGQEAGRFRTDELSFVINKSTQEEPSS